MLGSEGCLYLNCFKINWHYILKYSCKIYQNSTQYKNNCCILYIRDLLPLASWHCEFREGHAISGRSCYTPEVMLYPEGHAIPGRGQSVKYLISFRVHLTKSNRRGKSVHRLILHPESPEYVYSSGGAQRICGTKITSRLDDIPEHVWKIISMIHILHLVPWREWYTVPGIKCKAFHTLHRVHDLWVTA